MKMHYKVLLVSALICSLLVGCENDNSVLMDITPPPVSENIEVYVDKETGVNYLVLNRKRYNAGMGGICPRYNADGSLYITNSDEEETSQNAD